MENMKGTPTTSNRYKQISPVKRKDKQIFELITVLESKGKVHNTRWPKKHENVYRPLT